MFSEQYFSVWKVWLIGILGIRQLSMLQKPLLVQRFTTFIDKTLCWCSVSSMKFKLAMGNSRFCGPYGAARQDAGVWGRSSQGAEDPGGQPPGTRGSERGPLVTLDYSLVEQSI